MYITTSSIKNEDKSERIKRYEIMAIILTPTKLYCTSGILKAKARIPVNEPVFITIIINANNVLIFSIFEIYFYNFFIYFF